MREASGTAYLKKGKWYYGVRIPGTKKRVLRPIPPRSNGRPIDEEYARQFAAGAQALANAGKLPATKTKAPPTAIGERSTHTVISWARAWISRQGYETRNKDASHLELYVRPYPLAEMPLNEVRPRDVRGWMESLRARPSANGGTLAPRTLRSVWSVVKRAFGEAVVDGEIPINPCGELRRMVPTIADKIPGARATWKFSSSEVQSLITPFAKIPPERTVLYALLCLTGGRWSECAALRWLDLTPAAPLDRLIVSRAISTASRRETHTKTGATKHVPVIPTLARILSEWQSKGWADAYGRVPTRDDFIVPTRRFTPRSPDNGSRHLRADLVALGLPHRKIHSMRRTFVSLAQDHGAEAAVLRWVTHAPPREAFDLYTTFSWERLCAATLTLERALASGSPATHRLLDQLPRPSEAMDSSGKLNGDTVESNHPIAGSPRIHQF